MEDKNNYRGEVKGEYNAREYFGEKYRFWPDLRGSGHRRFSLVYNEAMYEVAAERLQSALARNGINLQGKRILDIGPGVGYFVDRFIAWGAQQIVGVDITSASVDMLKAKFPGHVFMQGDISDEKLDLGNDYEMVAAISMIFHITDEMKFEKAINKMCQCTRPGGYLIIVDSFSKPMLPSGKHVRLRSLDAYLPTLKNHNFVIRELVPMYYVMGVSFFPILIPRILSNPKIVPLIQRFDRWLSKNFRSNLKALKFLITQKSA